MKSLARCAAALALLCACGNNEPGKQYGSVSLKLTAGDDCSVPLNLDHVTWNLYIVIAGKQVAAFNANYSAATLIDACVHAGPAAFTRVLSGTYVSNVTGYDDSNNAITNTASETVVVAPGASGHVDATLVPTPGFADVTVSIECCVDSSPGLSSPQCATVNDQQSCGTTSSACFWACTPMCCTGDSACTGLDMAACGGAAKNIPPLSCTWTKC